MADKNSGEKPFKVVDRRRFIYDPKSPGEVKHAAPEDPAPGEYEAFRTASFGGSDDNPKPAARYATPDRSETGLLRDELYADEARPNMPPEKYRNPIWPILAGGAAVIGLLIGIENYTRTNPGAHHEQPAQAQPALTPQASPAQNRGLPAFEKYEASLKELYSEFESSSEPSLASIPLPKGLINPAYEENAVAYQLDLNGDGNNETLVRVNNGAFSFLYAPDGRQILGDNIMRVSAESTNGYSNLWTSRRIAGVDSGETSARVRIRYVFSGNNYVESARIVPDAELLAMSPVLGEALDNAPSDYVRGLRLKNLGEEIGPHNALTAFVQSGMPSSIPLLLEPDRSEFLMIYDRENGTNFRSRFANNPEAFEHAMLSHAYDNMLTGKIAYQNLYLAAALAGIRVFAPLIGADSEAQFIARIDRTEQRNGVGGIVAGYRKLAGRNPTIREWADLKYHTNAIREEKLHVNSTPDTSEVTRSYSPNGGMIESRTFDPTDVPGDPRYLNRDPKNDRNLQMREMARKIDQESRAAIGREAGRIGGEISSKGREAARTLGEQLKGAWESLTGGKK